MKNTALLDKYRHIQLRLNELANKHFNLSPSFLAEMQEHALSSDELIQFLSSDTELIIDDEICLKLLHEAKQWLSSLNFNFSNISLDSLGDNHGIELAADEIEEENFQENDSYTNKATLDQLLQEQERHDPEVQGRLKLVKRLFPNGIEDLPDSKAIKKLSDNDILLFFKHHYLNLIDEYPVFFFKSDLDRKIKVIIPFFQSQILQLSIEEFATEKSIDDLIEHRLVSIARAVNYSWNNLLQIAYPNKFLPWQHGRVDQGYWENEDNRKNAVSWIIESYFNIKAEQIWQVYSSKAFTRKTFANLGLSYLYNQYFNSLLKALELAYPELDYWHFGIFPDNYWEKNDANENAIEAFRWMLNEESISRKNLIKAIEDKRLSRELFKKYNLSTMFDYVFNKNLFDLVEATFPNTFKIWEIGNVKKEYWKSTKNREDAIEWFLNEKQISREDVLKQIEQGEFQKKHFVTSKLANFFRRIFFNDPLKLFTFLSRNRTRLDFEDMRIMHLIKKRSKLFNTKHSLINFILHGFNYSSYKYYENEMNKRLQRKMNRRKRLMDREEK